MNEKPSLSKGIFVHKAKVKSSPTKQRQTDENHKKIKQFKSVWKGIEDKIQSIAASIHQEASTFVLDFVNNCYHNVEANPAVRLGAIPTIALIMGVNIPDHGSLFSLLSSSLREAGALVASLQGKDSPNIASLMQKLVQSIAEQQGADETLRRIDCTFETLASWYEVKRKQRVSSPRKKQKVSDPSLVIMLEDIEGFPPHVLQHFILICNHYLDRIPIILVLGVATAMVTVHNLLPLKVTSCLAMKVFTSPSASHLLNTIIEEVLIKSELPFRVGPKVFKFLTNAIIFHDFSVSNLSLMLKFCVFEHYFSNHASVLTYESVPMQVKMVTNNLPSFHKYLSDAESQEVDKSQERQKKVQKLLEDLNLYNCHLSLMLDCLHALAQDLPGSPLGKQRRELYLLFLQGRITDSEEYKNAFKLLKFLNMDDLQSRIVKVLEILMAEDFTHFISQTSDQDVTKSTLNELNDLLLQGPEEETEEEKEKPNTKLNLNIKGKITRHMLQEHLLKASKQRTKTKFEIWREDVVSKLDALFSVLPSVESVPLHETMYFDDVTSLKTHLNVSPKMAIHTALTDPQRYLQCKCCKLDGEDDTHSTFPPLCLAYKLMLEGGRLVNIHDWLQSYLSIKSQLPSRSPKRKSPRKERADDEKKHQAEFFQALSELQMLGIVKPNKRKTDHVARLTWGCC